MPTTSTDTSTDPDRFHWRVEITAVRETRQHDRGEILDRAFFSRGDDALMFAYLHSDADAACTLTLFCVHDGRLLSADFSHGAAPEFLLDTWGRPDLAIPAAIRDSVRGPQRIAA